MCLKNFDLTEYCVILSDGFCWLFQGIIKNFQKNLSPIISNILKIFMKNVLPCGQVKKRVGIGISKFSFFDYKEEFGDVKKIFEMKIFLGLLENFSLSVSELNFNDLGKCLIFSNVDLTPISNRA